MDENSNDKQRGKWPEDDKVIYIPEKEYLKFMQSLCKLEQAQKEFHEIRDKINS